MGNGSHRDPRHFFIVIFESRTEIIPNPPLSGTSCIVAYKGCFRQRDISIRGNVPFGANKSRSSCLCDSSFQM